jgi:hypothetical protein
VDVLRRCSCLPEPSGRCLNYFKPLNADPFGIVDAPDRPSPRPGVQGQPSTKWA